MTFGGGRLVKSEQHPAAHHPYIIIKFVTVDIFAPMASDGCIRNWNWGNRARATHRSLYSICSLYN